ncbi:MAG: hypothetical protein E7507_03145 [Ruminococcus sp.]|nr:hypothetical protein [Ruminococcus sp.]
MPIEKKKRRALSEELAKITQQIENVNRKIDLTEDEDLLDALIYEELSLKARFRQILKEAKRQL